MKKKFRFASRGQCNKLCVQTHNVLSVQELVLYIIREYVIHTQMKTNRPNKFIMAYIIIMMKFLKKEESFVVDIFGER